MPAAMEMTGAEPAADHQCRAITELGITDLYLIELEELYGDITVNNKTSLAAAKAARRTLKGVRVNVEHRRKELKRDALDWGKVVDGEARRVTSRLKALEDPIDGAIKQVEEAAAREKEQASIEEEARVRGIRNAIRQLTDTPVNIQGRPIEVMEAAIQALQQTEIGEAFGEFAEHATGEKQHALTTCIRLLDSAKEQKALAEQQAAEAQRLETERQAMAEEKARLQAEQEQLDREKAQIAADAKADVILSDILDGMGAASSEHAELRYLILKDWEQSGIAGNYEHSSELLKDLREAVEARHQARIREQQAQQDEQELIERQEQIQLEIEAHQQARARDSKSLTSLCKQLHDLVIPMAMETETGRGLVEDIARFRIDTLNNIDALNTPMEQGEQV